MTKLHHVGSLLVVALLVTLPRQLAAQAEHDWAIGAQGGAGLLVGGSSDLLDGGLGLDVSVARLVAPHLRVRVDGILLGLDDVSHPTETADNRILIIAIGPELSASVGPFHPYTRGLVGLTANMQVRTGSPIGARTTWASALGAGAGIGVTMSHSVTLDVAADALALGELDFARPAVSGGSLRDDPVLLRLGVGVRIHTGRGR